MTLTASGLIDLALSNPINAQLFERLPSLGLNQTLLTAGCLFQAVWNRLSDRPAEWGVNDYDVFYFDEDLSWEAENRVIVAAQALFEDLDVKVELRNQARVHLWFADRFGNNSTRRSSPRKKALTASSSARPASDCTSTRASSTRPMAWMSSNRGFCV